MIGVLALALVAGIVLASSPLMETQDELMGEFEWFAGADFDEDSGSALGLPPFGDAAAVAEDGSLILISGSGTFTLERRIP